MDFDFTPYFNSYEKIRAAAEAAFENIKRAHPDAVKCKLRCDDCCHAVFDLSFIEALYISYHFNRQVDESDRLRIIEKANQADRRVYKLKREAVKAARKGASEEKIITKMGKERVTCPLLSDEHRCEMYHLRPITCRVYGVPMAIGGKGRTCGLSEFKPGVPYPTINIDKLNQSLYDLSAQLVRALESRHARMAEMLVPLSMALLTSYNETYLGIGPEPEPEKPSRKRHRRGIR